MAAQSIASQAQSLLCAASAPRPSSSLARSLTIDRVTIGDRIGSGAFAKVYAGTCDVTGAPFAIKVEVEPGEDRRVASPLTLEWGFYAHLQRAGGGLSRCPAIPRALYLLEPDPTSPPPFVRLMVMELCQQSLMGAVREHGVVPHDVAPRLRCAYPGARIGGAEGFLQLDHAAWVLHELLGACREIHARHVVHRDIKPANVVVQRGRLLLIDFGLAKRVIEPGGAHIPYHQRSRFAGTPLYASLNVHRGVQTTRRDDIWSCVITALACAGWPLPWGHLGRDEVRAQSPGIIADTAEWMPSVPQPFAQCLQVACSLGFDEAPPYDALQEAVAPHATPFLSTNGGGGT